VYDTLRSADWRVTICLTAAAAEWVVDAPQAALQTGRIRPDAVICCPATFNTLNKWAAGINDSPALGVLNDALGLGTPTLVVPMVAERLSRHPVWPATLAFLATAGVEILDPADGQLTARPRSMRSGTGDQVADDFNPASLLTWLGKSTHLP
jgi:phosphopantothenoylcysteine synthetase/decarboxylase